jgi:hypothetical protein
MEKKIDTYRNYLSEDYQHRYGIEHKVNLIYLLIVLSLLKDLIVLINRNILHELEYDILMDMVTVYLLHYH